MGIGFSAGFSFGEAVGREIGGRPGLGDIPESCAAMVLACLDPQEVCMLARLNRTFRLASSADVVWEPKLPENYRVLADKLFDESPETLPMKEIYAKLSRPLRFHSGNKEMWLDKSGGGVCVSISWKGMKITGIDDRRYWNHIPTHESSFNSIAYLQQTWWLQVEGEIDFEFPAGTYSLFFRLQLGRPTRRLGRRACSLDHVRGWKTKPVRFHLSASSSDGLQEATSQYYLKEVGDWVYYHAGDFVASGSDLPTCVRFSMTQIDCTHTKGGLCVDCVYICPAPVGEKLKHSR